MQAEIITIGDEILIGQIVDSNSASIAKELNNIGVSVFQITSIQDDRAHILDALEQAVQRSSVVILTGGLGPTKDDITKTTLCDFFDDKLVRNQTVLNHIEELFKKYISTPISDMNRNQALVPSKATILHNNYGTAPGLWMKKQNTAIVSLPGVPFEMRNLIVDQVLPKIIESYERPYIIHRTLLTYGLGESAIAERIEHWENNLPNHIKLAYLPNLGRVRLRLTGKGKDKAVLESQINEQKDLVLPLIEDIFYGIEDEGSLEQQVAKLFTEKGMTLGAAESFTGGKIAELLTAIPGASKYFNGSIVSYATEAKVNVLGVSKDLISRYSVVSEEVAMAMASNAKKMLSTDFAIATTGNAGPSKGDSDVDIGTVYIGISTPEATYAKKFTMGNHRERIVKKSVNKAFELLWQEILKI